MNVNTIGYRRRKADHKRTAGPASKQWPTVARQNEKRSALLDQVSRGTAVFSARGTLIDCNDAYRELYALTEELSAQGTSLNDILTHQVDQGLFTENDPETYIGNHINMVRKGEIATRAEDQGNGKTITISHMPMQGGGWITLIDDITHICAIKDEIEHSAFYDRRTALPNEKLLLNALDDAFVTQWDEESFALIAIDFSAFEKQMERFPAADRHALLAAVAERVQRTVRDSDMPTKLKGAKFAVLQNEVTCADDAEALVRRLATVLSMPYTLEGKTFMPAFHLGIAMADNVDMPENEFLQRAFTAAGQARAIGKQRYAFYMEEEKALSA